MLQVTREQLVEMFTIWNAEFEGQTGIYAEDLDVKFKDESYAEFAAIAFEHYLTKVKGE